MYYRPNSGETYYDGKNLYELDDDELAGFRNRELGFVFQFHHLLPEFSAMENVLHTASLTAKIQPGHTSERENLWRELVWLIV